MSRRVARVCLLIIGLAVGVVIAEGFARLLQPHARDAVIPGFFASDDELGWRMRPARTSRHRTRYFETTYTTNSLGYRDQRRTTSAGGGRHKIALYGDSLVFGWGVADGERFSDIMALERPTLEVWNHGVPGYGLDQEIVAYEEERHRLPIDEVMFFVGETTLSRIHTGFIFGRYKPMFVQEPDGRLTLIGIPKARNVAMGVVSEMLIRLYAPALLRTAAANVQAGFSHASTSGADERLVGAFENALLGRAVRAARESNHRMSILAANLSRDDRRVLHDFCRDNGVTFLEISLHITAGKLANAESGLVFGEYDKHWNAKANAIIAQELLAHIRN